MRSWTMRRSVRPRKSYRSIVPAVPYVSSSARANAVRPAPRTLTSVPSMSKRKRRTLRRRQAADASDHRRHRIEHEIDLAGGGPAAEREAERALGGVAVTADRPQHVRRLSGHRRAGGARRGGDAAQVEVRQHALGLHARHDDRHVMWEPFRSARAGQARVLNPGKQSRQESIAQLTQTGP